MTTDHDDMDRLPAASPLDDDLIRWAQARSPDILAAEPDARAAARAPANPADRDFTGARLDGADLTGADLRGVDLTGVVLSWATLTHARLDGADLTGAWLDGADLTGAVLSWATLTRAGLVGADLTDADLREANLRGADLTGAWLGGADLTGTLWSRDTRWPDAGWAWRMRDSSDEVSTGLFRVRPDSGRDHEASLSPV